VRLLHATSSRGGFAGSLGSELLTRSLTSGRFTCGLFGPGEGGDLSTLSTDAAGQLDVLRHDRDALGVDRAQVGVLEEANQVRLRGLLERVFFPALLPA
jgi:hypothetical protein